MKVTASTGKEIEVRWLRVHLPKDVVDDKECDGFAMPKDFYEPHLDMYVFRVDLHTRRIENWPPHRTDTYYIVEDRGDYFLDSPDGKAQYEWTNTHPPKFLLSTYEYKDTLNFEVARDGTWLWLDLSRENIEASLDSADGCMDRE